ncbi:hypothetical protein [Faecousia sp.]|uniref:hypothetical protein n=1 Tax=Faecousia sp. TaxID=2952921 RepID=UPI003AB1C100
MKKTVLILLAAFLLCTLIIFSTACENHQEQPAMQIELAVNSACRVENAAGQSLTFRNGTWEGDMAASGVSMNCFDDTTMTLEIPYTEALHYTHESGESRFSVLRGQESILLSGDGIDEVRVTQDSLTVTGSGMNYRLKVARSEPERRTLAFSGSEAGTVSLHFADSSCTLQSDAAVTYALSGDSNSPFLRDTVPAQTELTIRDPWCAQEDVVVKVDS